MHRDSLLRYPLFSLLSPVELDAWIASSQELTFDSGEIVFREGSSGAWIYLVVDGRVRIIRRSASGREKSLGVAGPGELLGDYSLLPPHLYTATCRAAETAHLLRLPTAPLCIALSAYANISANLKPWLTLHSLLNFLRNQAFLGFMSAPTALMHLNQLKSVRFHAGRIIQARGLADDHIFIIESGRVALRSANEPSRDLGPGDCFGEQAIAGFLSIPAAETLAETCCHSLPRSSLFPESETSRSWTLQSALESCHGTYPWVGQQSKADCGVAAIAMIARCCGISKPVAELRRNLPPHENGLSLIDLQHLAESAGLTSFAVRLEGHQLENIRPPAIAHLKDGHYVVLFERSDCQIMLGDPATGIVTLSRPEFERIWSGNMLLLSMPNA